MQHKRLPQTYTKLLLTCLCGFLLALLSNSTTSPATIEANSNELADYIKQIESSSALLEQEISTTRDQIMLIQTEYATGESLLGGMNQLLQELNCAAGMTAMQGAGLSIILDDNTTGAAEARQNNSTSYDPEHFIIHDKDLLYLIRALAPKAEAIAINGIRLIDTSSIRCAGTVIMVNSVRLAPPYRIDLLGDVAILKNTLLASGRYKRLVYSGFTVQISEHDILELPAYTGSYTTNYSSLIKP